MKRPGMIFLFVFCCGVLSAQQRRAAMEAAGDTSAQMISLPVFSHFSGVVRESNKVYLQWDNDSALEGDYFIVERSTDGMHYETVGAVRKTSDLHYELTDVSPPNGVDWYRIKYAAQNGQVVYSDIVQVSLSGNVDFKFYPNPADKLLIIRTEHALDMQILDAGGAVRINRRLQPGIQVVNVSSLEHGIYILRVADKESNRIVSNQLVKN